MIEIYGVNIEKKIDRELGERLLPFIDEAKQDRVKKFYRWEDAQRALVAELLARYVIMKRIHLRNDEITFAVNRFGKPHLKGREDFHFNLSHSGDWIVCAVSDNPIGIDVEKISSNVDLNIAKNYFSQAEHTDLLKSTDKYSYFFNLWTLKESYIKIVGKGLSVPLSSFSIRFIDNNDIRIEDKDRGVPEKYFKLYEVDDYKIAVCASMKEFPLSIININVGEVISAFLGESYFFHKPQRKRDGTWQEINPEQRFSSKGNGFGGFSTAAVRTRVVSTAASN